MTQPRPVAPWPTPPTACCELAAGGDYCDCAAFAAELTRAFASPLVLELNGGTWGWER